MHTSSSTHDSTEQLLGATVEEREREFNGSCFSLRHSISIIVLYILESAHFFVDNLRSMPTKERYRNAQECNIQSVLCTRCTQGSSDRMYT